MRNANAVAAKLPKLIDFPSVKMWKINLGIMDRISQYTTVSTYDYSFLCYFYLHCSLCIRLLPICKETIVRFMMTDAIIKIRFTLYRCTISSRINKKSLFR